MKLVIATPLYPPESGGPATYAKLLASGLSKEGIEVVSVCKFSDIRSQPPVVRHSAYFWKVFGALKGADLVLALDPVSVGFPTMLAALLRGKPYVVKIVGDYAWEQGTQRFGVSSSLDDFQQNRDGGIAALFLRFVQTTVANFARAVIVPSNYLKTIITAWGVTERKITVIYNALQTESIGTVPSDVAALAQPLIVSVGRLVPWKNMLGVIDAVDALQKDGVPASLAIVGDGPDKVSIAQYAARIKNTVCTGTLSHRDTLAVIDRADVFVLNSTYEGLSHLLIEAASLGVPVVATDVGGNKEVITHNVNGLLVPSGNKDELVKAIRHLFDKGEAERLTMHASETAERFSESNMLEKTATFLHTLV